MDTKVDVVIVTKHPESIDGWNHTDSIPLNNLIIESSKPLALARKRAIEKVSTDWFVFMDDDIFLHLFFWWETISNYIADDVGAIQGTAIPIGLGRHYDKAFKDHFSNGPDVKELNGNSRMFTHNTLIRTEAVRDWNPPDGLETYEDYDLMRHIQKKGYRCFVVKTETYHQYCWSKLWPMGRWGTRGMLRFFPASRVLANFFGIPLEYLRHGFRIGTVNAVKQTAGLYELIVGGR